MSLVLRRMDGAWRMMVNYNITKAVAPITTALPDALSLLEQIDVDSGTWYAAILGDWLFSITITKKGQKQLTFPSCGMDNCMHL